MSELKNTPAPWEVIDHNGPLSIYGPDAERVARICHMDVSEGGEKTKRANANLIAAAPDMFEALELLLNVNQLLELDEEAVEKAKAAMKKAMGEK